MNAPRRLLIDTDPGIDDALALLFALRSPQVEVVAATSIFGNADTARCTANLARLLQFAPTEVPIGVGAYAPLVDPARPYASFVHGDDGLGDCGLAGRTMPNGTDYAASLIVSQVLAHPGELTIVALGPLTNLALALALEPRIESAVAEVVIMGGAYGVNGNVTSAAEANIIHDVHAAERVLAAAWPTTLVSLDVTNTVIMSGAYLNDLALGGGEEAQFLREVSRCYERFHYERHGIDGIVAHDPTALMWAVAPELFRTELGPATVLTAGPAAGQTLIDRRPSVGTPDAWASRSPVRYCTGVDRDGLLELFRSTLRER